jgi:hypothetical protein
LLQRKGTEADQLICPTSGKSVVDFCKLASLLRGNWIAGLLYEYSPSLLPEGKLQPR